MNHISKNISNITSYHHQVCTTILTTCLGLRGMEEGNIPLSKHFECDIEVGGQVVHCVSILLKKDKVPLVNSKGRKAKTPALLDSNLIRIAVNEFCEKFGKECLQLFECPAGISPLWFSTLCLYYFAHIHQKAGIGASSVKTDDLSNNDEDKGSNKHNPSKTKNNKSQSQNNGQAKSEQDPSKGKSNQTGKGKQHSKKLNTLGGLRWPSHSRR